MRTFQDRQAEIFIGQVLRTGVLISGAVTLIGLFLYLLHHAGASPIYRAFLSSRNQFYSLPSLLRLAATGHAVAVMQLGILLLIATPVARVAFLIGAFALQRDKLYVCVSSLVLLVLLFSLFVIK